MRRVLGTPHVLPLVLSALVSYIGFGGRNLALILAVAHNTHSITLVGLVVSITVIAGAIFAPLRGQMIDRYGISRMTVPLAAIHAVAFLGIIPLLTHHGSRAILLILALAGGGSFPSVFASMRSIWSRTFKEDQAKLSAAYSLESVLQEIGLILGPLVISLAVTLVSISFGFAVAIILTSGGAILFAASPLARGWRSEDSARPRRGTGVIRHPGMRALLVTSIFFGGALGGVEILVPIFALNAHHVAVAGVLLGLLSLGSAIGGILYAAREKTKGASRDYAWLLLGLTSTTSLLVFARGLILLGFLLFAVGLVIAPTFVCVFGLLDTHAPAGRGTESFMWLTSANRAGEAATAAVIGATVQHFGISPAAAVPAAVAFLAFLVGGFSPYLRPPARRSDRAAVEGRES